MFKTISFVLFSALVLWSSGSASARDSNNPGANNPGANNPGWLAAEGTPLACMILYRDDKILETMIPAESEDGKSIQWKARKLESRQYEKSFTINSDGKIMKIVEEARIGHDIALSMPSKGSRYISVNGKVTTLDEMESFTAPMNVNEQKLSIQAPILNTYQFSDLSVTLESVDQGYEASLGEGMRILIPSASYGCPAA